MEIINAIITWALKKRIREVTRFMEHPHEVQEEVFNTLIHTAARTEFGKKHAFTDIRKIEDFKERVPVSNYDLLFPYIERIMQGEQNLLWPSEIKWFAKSSGTTGQRSKFIPVSPEALEDCHFKGGKDMISIYANNHPDTKLFTGKGLAIGGSHQINKLDARGNSRYGDVSAVIMKNLPMWAQYARTPSLQTALMDDWDKKVIKMAEETARENVTSISGIPTYTIVLIEQILKNTGAENILEVWPNLEVFVHGAVSFTPYQELFRQLIPSPSMRYLETYNATEGFFGIQDQPGSREMLLMLDYGIFYEFIRVDEVDKDNPEVLGLDQVVTGQSYAMVISTNAGLWRYMIGDTVKFTSLSPYRIQITGRTRHFINAFGEEVNIEQAENAIAYACEKSRATIDNFTAGPRYYGEKTRGSHEWIIEFSRPPASTDAFAELLDRKLRENNSDYDAKRHKDMALEPPIVHSVPKGTFYQWMKKRGKLGGQNKVPRLANNREYLDDILRMLEKLKLSK